MTNRIPAIVVLALVAAVGTGCSGGSSGSGPTAAGTSNSSGGTATSSTGGSGAGAATSREQGVKFSECMRNNGVRDFPDPNEKGEYEYFVSVTPAVFSKAVAACKDLEPPGALSSDRTPQQQTASLRFAQCMRDKGVKDFPDPVQGEPLINTYKIPSSDKPGGMAILNATIAKCRPQLDQAAAS
jgi:hypothetical protein